MASDYNQRTVVISLRSIPRFGHPAKFASLISAEDAERKEYTDGIVAFGILLGVLAFLWCVILLVLKFYYRSDRVGCAAGGMVQDVNEMRNNKLSRSARKSRVVRNWRIQVAFIVCSLLIPTLSFLMVNHGLRVFYDNLDLVTSLSEQTREKALNGIELAADFIDYQNRYGGILSHLQPENICSTPEDESVSELFRGFNNTLQRGMDEIDTFMETHVSPLVLDLSEVTHTSLTVDSTVEAALSYDWLIKGFLIALNTVNVFLLVGVCLTRSSIYHPLYQQFLTWFVVPAFCVVLCGSVVAVVITSALSMTNADFCSGGVSPATPLGSPQGTLQDIFESKGYNVTDLPYQALTYYANDCKSDNPFRFLQDFKVRVELLMYDVKYLLLGEINRTQYISSICGANTTQLIETDMVKLLEKLEDLETTIISTANLTACSHVEPVVRGLTNGSLCSESPQGLAWLLGTSGSLLLVGLVMLSLRAGLYNTVIKPRRIKRREREFQEYKEYMSSFYSTETWKMNSETKKNVLHLTTTLDSDSTATRGLPSSRMSENGEMNNNEEPSLEPSNNEGVYIEDSERKVSPSVTANSRRSRFRFHDPGVVYYSSDSEEDDSADESEGGISALSSALSRIFVKRRADAAQEQPSTLSPLKHPHGSVSPTTKSRWRKETKSSKYQTPLETPRRSPRIEDDVRGKAVALACESQPEMQSLSPSTVEKPQPLPQRPYKTQKNRSRTVGGAKMKE